MKATEKAYKKLEAILNEYGFCIRTDALGNRQVRSAGEGGGKEYVSIQIMEKHDRYENTDSFEDFRGYGHLEVAASICRMGGEMSVEDFKEAADQMSRCSGLLARLGNEDLSYTALINGEAA